jgi:hypothetical protein
MHACDKSWKLTSGNAFVKSIYEVKLLHFPRFCDGLIWAAHRGRPYSVVLTGNDIAICDQSKDMQLRNLGA